MKMSIGELRRVIHEQLEEDDEEGPVAAPWQVMDALVDWTASSTNRHVLTPRIIAGIRKMLDSKEGGVREPYPSMLQHRGLIMSRGQLERWLNDPELPAEGQRHVDIVVGKEAASSWSSRRNIAVNFAGRSKATVALYISDPVSVVMTTKASSNPPGTFIDMKRGGSTRLINSFADELESISLGPVKVDTVTWIESPESEYRYDAMDHLEKMVMNIK